MKVRLGFVSNSSSSSFICDVSGHVESGWDLSFNEAGMCSCENNHTFCESYLLNPSKEEIIDYWEKRLEKLKDDCDARSYEVDYCRDILTNIGDEDFDRDEFVSHDGSGSRSEIISICCPLCMKKVLNDREGFEFLLKHYKLSREDILEMMKNEN